MGQTFILTWNPDRSIWPDDQYESVVRQTAEERSSPGRLEHLGSRKGGVDLGDTVYLLRQHRQRGIVGTWDRRTRRRVPRGALGPGPRQAGQEHQLRQLVVAGTTPGR